MQQAQSLWASRGAVIAAAAALLAVSGPALAQPKPEEILAGTSWYDLSALEYLDVMTPEKRAAKQACGTPSRSFEVRGGKLVGRQFSAPYGYDTVYAKAVVTATPEGVRFDLFTDAAAAKPNDTFVLLKDGESMMNPTQFGDTGLLKCRSATSAIPAARPPAPAGGGAGR